MKGRASLSAAFLVALIAQPVHAASVPFVLVDNRIVVQARLNGTGPFSMIVDTGSAGTTLTPATAKRLHLAMKPFGPISGAGSRQVSASLATLDRVSVAGETFSHLPVAVVDMSEISRNIGFTNIDGIIGYDVLRSNRVAIDMDRDVLTLSRAPLPDPPDAHAVPFTIHNTLIYVPATIDGLAGTVMLDTGDRSSLTVFHRFASANGFYQARGVTHALTGFGIGGPIFADVFRTNVGIFGKTIPSVITRAPLDTGGFFFVSHNAGSIGLGLMKRFDTVIDYPGRTITTWPSRFYNMADRYDPAGMWVSNGSRGPVIAFVAKGGAADKASLQAGESLVSLNGRDVRGMSAIEIRDWLDAQPDGSRITLLVKKPSGKTAARTIVLHDRTLG